MRELLKVRLSELSDEDLERLVVLLLKLEPTSLAVRGFIGKLLTP